MSAWDGATILPHISTPTLIIRGAKDFFFEARYFSQFKALMPHAQEVLISVSAHQVMVERPDAVKRAIDRFLGGINWRANHAKRAAYQKQLEQTRPWLKWYDSRTPYEIRPPLGSAARYLEIAAQRFAASSAIEFYRRRLSYAQLDRLSNRFAQGLKRAGIVKSNAIVIALGQTPQAVIAYYGILKARAVAVFIDERHSSITEIVTRVKEVDAKMLLLLSNRYRDVHSLGQADKLESGTCKIYYSTYQEYMAWTDWLWYSLTQLHRLGHRMPWVFAVQKKRSADASNVHYFFELMALNVRPLESQPDVALIHYSSPTWGGHAKVAVMNHSALATNALQMRHWLPEAGLAKSGYFLHYLLPKPTASLTD